MKGASLIWLGKRQLLQDRKSLRAAVILLLMSSVLFTLSWLVNSSLSAYNLECANSTGTYDFELNGSSLPSSNEQIDLLAISSSAQGFVEGRETQIQYSTNPAVLFPKLYEGTYPQPQEVLVTYPAAVLYDLHPGDKISITFSKDDQPETVIVSGIVSNSFTSFILPGESDQTNSIKSGWYSLKPGSSLEEIQKKYPGATINYQRQQYLYSDRTNRLAASRILIIVSAAFLFLTLLSLDLTWMQKSRKDLHKLHQAGLSRRKGILLEGGILLFLQFVMLPLGYLCSIGLWKLILSIVRANSTINPFETLPSSLPFAFSAMDAAWSLLLLAGLAVCSLPLAFGLFHFRGKQKTRRTNADSLTRLLGRPFKKNPAFWLICLFVLLCGAGGVNLAAIAGNTPLPQAGEYTGIQVYSTINFSKASDVSEFFDQAQSDLPESEMTMTTSGTALNFEPTYSVLKDGTPVSMPYSVLKILPSQTFHDLFGADCNMPVHLAPGKNKTTEPAWFSIGDLPDQEYANILELEAARRAMVTQTDAYVLDPQENGLENIMDGMEDIWVFTPEMIEKLQKSPSVIRASISIFTSSQPSEPFAAKTLALMQHWKASSYSLTNTMAMVENLRAMGMMLIASCMLVFVLLLFCGTIVLQQLLILLFESQKPDLLHLRRAGLSKRMLGSKYCRLYGICILVFCIASIFFSQTFWQMFSSPDPWKCFLLLAAPLLVCILFFLLFGLQTIGRLFKTLL